MSIRRHSASPPPLSPRSIALAVCAEALIVVPGAWLATGRTRPEAHVRSIRPARVAVPDEPVELASYPDEIEPQPRPVERALITPEPPELRFPPAPEPNVSATNTPPDVAVPDRAWLTRVRQAKAKPVVIAVPTALAAPTPPPRVAVPAPKTQRASPQPLQGLNTPPPYPARAIRLRQEGITVLHLDLDAEGRVRNARVAESSGHRLLDLVTQRALERWRFSFGPATVTWRIEFRIVGQNGKVSGRATTR